MTERTIKHRRSTSAPGARRYADAARHLAETDKMLGRLIERIGPYRLGKGLRPTTTTFAALLEAITHQQLSTKAAATIFSRVRAIDPDLDPAVFLSTKDTVLRQAGLSRAKVLGVLDPRRAQLRRRRARVSGSA